MSSKTFAVVLMGGVGMFEPVNIFTDNVFSSVIRRAFSSNDFNGFLYNVSGLLLNIRCLSRNP